MLWPSLKSDASTPGSRLACRCPPGIRRASTLVLTAVLLSHRNHLSSEYSSGKFPWGYNIYAQTFMFSRREGKTVPKVVHVYNLKMLGQ